MGQCVEPQRNDDPPASWLRPALFLTALCTILLEILLTRVLSVVMWYHFTFAVISVSLLGIAAGALRCYGKPIPDLRAAVSLGLNLFSVAVFVPVALMLVFIETPTFSWRGTALLLVYFTACAGPFYASGYVTAAVFRHGKSQISSLYAVDLLGGALGCLLAIPMLNLLGGIGSLLAVSVLSAGGAAFLAWHGPPSRRRSALATLGVFAAFLVLQAAGAGADVQTVKLSLRERQRPILEVKWNSHSRLAVLDYWDGRTPFPFLAWGLSDRYQGWLPHQYLITIDGASETPITYFNEDIARHEYLAWDITSAAYHLRPAPKTLVIGAGGGRDLLTALHFGSTDVTGVELNHGIVDWVRGRYAGFAGHLFERPGVRVVADDGRNFVRASSDRYDVLQISMIDTFAATAAGAYTLSENNLYTVEAFGEYLDHLNDNGILTINRFFLDPPQQTLRVVTLAREALRRRGVTDPAAHLAVVRKNSPLGDNGLVMIAKAPWTSQDLAAIRRLCAEKGFEIVALPGVARDNPFTAYLQEPDPERFYQAYPFDVRPPTDDRPFFFNTFKTSAVVHSLRLRQDIEDIRVYNFDAAFILFVLLALAGVLQAVFLFWPLYRQKARGGSKLPGRTLLYFVWVGLGFMLVEVVLIQRFNLYLGHPIYSLAVILVTVLACSGIGSALSGWVSGSRLVSGVLAATGAVALLVLLGEIAWPLFLQHTLGMPRAARIALTVIALLPFGVALGIPYPLGLRLLGEHSDGLPWVWAVNAAASVLGSILAFALAMLFGFRLVFLVGAACYLAALLSAWLCHGRRRVPASSEAETATATALS